VTAAFLQRGGGWVLAQSLLLLAGLAAGPLGRSSGPLLPAVLAGWALVGLGAVFGLTGVAVLGRNRTIFPKPKADSTLIQHGIYRWVRHPLYTAVMALSAGWALLWSSWPAGVAAVALVALLYFKALREERWLQAQFPAYAAYARRVRRFVPGLW
jgi:protein-S-isoprenylcysteine O-methyltransferase Ste14